MRAHLLWSRAWPAADAAPVLDLVRSWAAWLSRRGLGDEYLRVGGLYTESDYWTENRLRAAPEEDDKGTLELGKLADIAVLDQDALTAAEDALPNIRADLVIVGGEVVLDTWSPSHLSQPFSR